MRSPQTEEINQQLQIVRLGEQKFRVPEGYAIPQGYAFCHPQLGYLGFKDKPNLPYTPVGGKQALESIMAEGGFLNFDNCIWVKPM
ncbi:MULTISPECIES: hypothetical protein [Paenibacillus]|uniref:hypothetical protein n=1 Tax=Paenibacillus TaxID=44249 RepID=UPI000B59178D|nr:MULTISPECIES: hypothetical protein [Paenibacillus]